MKRKIAHILLLLLILSVFTAPKTLADARYPVRITEQTFIVSPVDPDTLQIVQMTTFTNGGNAKEEKLPLYLPQGYTNLQVRSGLEAEFIEETEKGIVDASGLEPGAEKSILVTYNMPLSSNTSQWDIETAYVAENFEVIIQPGILSFEATALVTQSDLFEMNNQEFRRFTRLDLHPDTPWTLSFNLIGLPNGASETNPTPVIDAASYNPNFTEDGYRVLGDHGNGYGKAALTISIIILALSITIIGLKRDFQKSINQGAKPKRSWLLAEKESLVKDIVQLERDFQANLISGEIYQKSYNELKGKLKRIIAELR